MDVRQQGTVALPDDLHPLDGKGRTSDLDRIVPQSARLDSRILEGFGQAMRSILCSWHHE